MVVMSKQLFTERLSKAVSRLMNVSAEGDRARVSVPILYPSGSSSAVEIILNGSNCFVSDLALGQMEADMYGAGSFYDVAARKSADRFGVGYDGLSIFAVWAPVENIESAIMSVANASITATNSAIFKAIDDKEKKKNDELFDRVVHIFGRSDVLKEAEVVGRDAKWDAHNVVVLSDRKKLIFEYITESQNSIAAKYMMFSDLSKSQFQYALTSVVSNVGNISRKGTMLAEVSTVMQIASNDDDYKRRAIIG